MRSRRAGSGGEESRALAARLRIIGGELRGRTIQYNGDPGLRPMKDRVREAVFNLVGPSVRDRHVVDLFGGTGAMAFEALSRGARHGVIIERKFPNVRVIEETAAELGLQERLTILAGDAFRWAPRHVPTIPGPWVVFCCPPYEFFVSRRREMLTLISTLWEHAGPGSVVVVEGDERLPVEELPAEGDWDVRPYPPAVIALARREA
ncbi:MAG: RsmD family RNA methyltransferase [Pirellulaceae bacterium]